MKKRKRAVGAERIAGAIYDRVNVRAGSHHTGAGSVVELILANGTNIYTTVVISLDTAFDLHRQLEQWGISKPPRVR